MTGLERFEGDKLCELAAQDLRVATEVMHQAVRCLLILSKVSALVKATRSRRVHEEIWWARKLDNKTTRSQRSTFSVRCWVAVVQCDILDEREWVLDLVTGRVVVDVVRNTALLGRVKDDEVHGTLTNSAPRANAQGAAREMVDD
jgi:hypothetical protein